jgi:hypothetical protein
MSLLLAFGSQALYIICLENPSPVKCFFDRQLSLTLKLPYSLS